MRTQSLALLAHIVAQARPQYSLNALIFTLSFFCKKTIMLKDILTTMCVVHVHVFVWSCWYVHTCKHILVCAQYTNCCVRTSHHTSGIYEWCR